MAFGESVRVCVGLRKSKSINNTRFPLRAMSAAMPKETVDLPSFGTHDVRPMTLQCFAPPFRSTVSFMDRIASANGENGASITVRNVIASGEMDLGRPRPTSKRCCCLFGNNALGLLSAKAGTIARHSV